MSTPSDQNANETGAPLSRREAREAAARESDAAAADARTPEAAAAAVPTPELPGSDDGAAAVPAPAVPAPAVPAPEVPDAAEPPVRHVPAPAVPGAEPAASGDVEAAPAKAAADPSAFDDLLGVGEAPKTRKEVGDERVQTRDLTSIDALFESEPVKAEPKVKERKKRGGCLVGVIVMVVVLGLVGGGIAFAWNTFGTQIQDMLGMGEPKDYESGLAGEDVMVTIDEGDTGADISKTLYAAGVTKTANAFYDYLRTSGSKAEFYPGLYKMRTKLPAAEAEKMLADPANKLENTVLVREGEIAAQAYKTIATVLKVPEADVVAAAKDPKAYGVDDVSLEGWLFPATYTFDEGTTPTQAIQAMVDRMNQALDEHGVPAADRHRILTIASIIQKEARKEPDFYKVSRVIENRLSPDNDVTHGKLQLDSTVAYGTDATQSGVVSTTDEQRAADNPYNTYLHAGLPVGPISLPGDVAIDAAMHPVDGPWYFFVTVNLDTGETVFSTTAAEHDAAVEKWQQWCQANPDGGC